MDRSKRAIKTPKRFDEEAFITPPKHQYQAKQQAEVAKLSQETPTPTKNIIKVKLTSRSKTKQVAPKQTPPTSQSFSTSQLELPDTPEQPPPAKSSKESTSTKSKDSVKVKVEWDQDVSFENTEDEIIKVETDLPLDTGDESSCSIKSKDAPKPVRDSPTKPATVKKEGPPKRESVGRPPKDKQKELAKPKDVKPKDLLKMKDLPKIEVRTPDRDTQFVYRPRMKRPRTPPVFEDVIPNVVLPFWDARTAAEEHEDDNVKELVHCHCGIAEELGLMIQCETCLTWQHAHCLGYENAEEVPDGYTCKACSDPKFARESMKYAYNQDWLTKGRMKEFSATQLPDSISEKRSSILHKINQLIENVLNIDKIVHSLKIKRRILSRAEEDSPELKAFNFPWPASYQHSDGTYFVPTVNQAPNSPASTISVIGETPDPVDITADNVADGALPDIGQLEDVSAILDNPYVNNNTIQPMTTNNNDETQADDCKANLKLHIQQTEEFINLELGNIGQQLAQLEREFTENKLLNPNELGSTLEPLKNDLLAMRRYIANQQQSRHK